MHVGGTVTFTVAFTNTSGSATDPTTVSFWLNEVVDASEREWTYNAAPVEGTHYPTGANPIVKDATGNYHVVYVTRKAERHVGFWLGTGTVNQSSQTTVFVRHTDVRAIDGV
jgi:hypothetical protein